jgi:hypothetical protein
MKLQVLSSVSEVHIYGELAIYIYICVCVCVCVCVCMHAFALCAWLRFLEISTVPVHVSDITRSVHRARFSRLGGGRRKVYFLFFVTFRLRQHIDMTQASAI